jgi:hypothetical protein
MSDGTDPLSILFPRSVRVWIEELTRLINSGSDATTEVGRVGILVPEEQVRKR